MIGYAIGGIKKSLSGWEKSHFGGFRQMINDYPYIKLDYKVQIELSKKITEELQWFTGEKLIKLYLIKAKEVGVLEHLDHETVVIPNKFTGKDETYVMTHLDSTIVFDVICNRCSEYAPLFEHFKVGIFESYLLKKQEEDSEKDDNPGDKKSDEENKEDGSEGQCKKSKEQNQEDMKTMMKKLLEEIKEFDSLKSKGSSLSGFNGKPTFMRSNPFDISTEYVFRQSEIKDAENLLKLLDINFDPVSAEVKSLRAGKLDTLKLAEVVAGSTSIYKQTVDDQDTKPFGVCILADLSGSMTHNNRLLTQKHTLNVLYLALSQIIPANKLWIYGHTGNEQPDIYSFHTPYDTNYPLNIQTYDRVSYGQNYDGPVIEAIHKKIREASDDRIIFISLSDGQPSGECYGGEDDIIDMKRILERARRDEFVTVSIGMQYMATPGLYIYNKTVNNLMTLAKDVSQVVNQVVRAEFK